MPIVYRCRRCGYVLYVFARVGQSSYGVATPSEVKALFGGRCPRCGGLLGEPRARDVDVVADPGLVRARLEMLREELVSQHSSFLQVLRLVAPRRHGEVVA